MIKSFFSLIYSEKICCGYLLESPQRGDSNIYPQHMFLGVLNTVFLNISNYLPHLELRNRSNQIIVKTNFVVISIVGIKRFDCSSQFRIPNDPFCYTLSIFTNNPDLSVSVFNASYSLCFRREQTQSTKVE